eukprot:53915_1
MMSNNVQSGPQPGFKEYVMQWYSNARIVSRSIVILSIAGAVLALVQLQLFLFTANAPLHMVAYPINVYRIFTSWIFPIGFLSGLIQALIIYSVVSRLESQCGSLFVLAHGLYLNFITQFMFVFVVVLLSFVPGTDFLTASAFSAGLMPAFFCLLPLSVVVFGEELSQRRIWFLPPIPGFVYPFALCLFFNLFGIRLDLIIAVCVGHLYATRFVHFQINAGQLTAWQRLGTVRWAMSSRSGYVVVPGTTDTVDEAIPFTGQGYRLNSSPRHVPDSPGHPLVEAYAASKAEAGAHINDHVTVTVERAGERGSDSELNRRSSDSSDVSLEV